jgi:hypothetical protein
MILTLWWGIPCRDEIDFVDDAFLFATYDPPQQLMNRYNEVTPLTATSTGTHQWGFVPSCSSCRMTAGFILLSSRIKAPPWCTCSGDPSCRTAKGRANRTLNYFWGFGSLAGLR